jgi:hypothetical protein
MVTPTFSERIDFPLVEKNRERKYVQEHILLGSQTPLETY